MGRADGRDRQVTTVPVDDTGASILHVDMDAFFASVELLDRPELVGRPALVGHSSGRSVVSSATYEARKHGVRSAMPVSQALRLCPAAVVLEPHFEKYRDYSERVMRIFRDVTPLIEQVSIDEAFLDVSGARRLLGAPTVIAAALRRRVRAETGLPCSIGVAATKFVAKVASGRAKPDGLLVVPAADTLAFLHPLPVGALWGVGPAMQQTLARFGLRTVRDVAETPLEVLVRHVGRASGVRLWQLANGIDERPVSVDSREKSVGHEQTFEHDVADPVVIRREILRLATQTAGRLRRGGLAGRTIALKLRYADFRTVTRSRTLPEATNVGRRIYDEAASLFDALGAAEPVRLVGVRVESIEAAGAGPELLWDPDESWRGAERAIDGVSERFGRAALTPASLVGTRPRKVGDTSSLRAHRDAGGDERARDSRAAGSRSADPREPGPERLA